MLFVGAAWLPENVIPAKSWLFLSLCREDIRSIVCWWFAFWCSRRRRHPSETLKGTVYQLSRTPLIDEPSSSFLSGDALTINSLWRYAYKCNSTAGKKSNADTECHKFPSGFSELVYMHWFSMQLLCTCLVLNLWNKLDATRQSSAEVMLDLVGEDRGPECWRIHHGQVTLSLAGGEAAGQRKSSLSDF